MNPLKLRGKKILLISPEPWGNLFVSKHHYAVQLGLLGNQIFFLNPPENRSDIHIEETDHVNVKKIIIGKRMKGLRFFPKFLQAIFDKKLIDSIQKRLSLKFDVIWCFDTSLFNNLDHISNVIFKILHIVDYDILGTHQTLAKSSDLVLCTTEGIRSELNKHNDEVHNIGHGLSSFAIDQKPNLNSSKSDALNAGYLGNLQIDYIDWSNIIKAIEMYPNITFHFFGPYEKSNLGGSIKSPDIADKIKSNDNCTLHGPIASTEVISKLSEMDILFILYKDDDIYTRALANPHKILEYLYTGKIIISYKIDEYKNHNHLIELLDSNTEFSFRLGEVASKIKEYNSIEKSTNRIKFAKTRSYKNQISKIEALINASKAKKQRLGISDNGGLQC